MKKIYINPEIEIIKIASQNQMLAGSSFSREDDFGGGSGGSSESGIGSADGHFTDEDW